MFGIEMKTEMQRELGEVAFDEDLSRYTTSRVGGPADALVYPKGIEELGRCVRFSRQKKMPLFVLGAGSNLLVQDKGIRGLVVNLRNFSRLALEDSEVRPVVYAEAGVGIPRLVDFAALHGLSGLEGVAGIPGNVGGGLFMNAGTPTGQMGDRLASATFMAQEGKLVTWERESLQFGYRTSHFPKGAIIVSARFSLERSTPSQVMETVRQAREQRVKHQPLNLPNLGSVFKNPPGKFAGALIEEAGLKGVRVGQARISPKHANFIVNEGGATAKDIRILIGLIRDKVKEKFNVSLEPEVRIVGEA